MTQSSPLDRLTCGNNLSKAVRLFAIFTLICSAGRRNFRIAEGRSLLFSPQLRGMHRLLGAVHSSDRPPPFVHLSDGAAADRVGLIELLRRRQVSALPLGFRVYGRPHRAPEEKASFSPSFRV
jgi:hypothetical protein